MKKLKQSFTEVISGQPRREHYINVTVAVLAIALVAGALITATFMILNIHLQ